MADDDALFQRGMPIRREVLGPEYVDASMARADEFMMSFQRATTAWAWGWAWGDATLDRKTRSLMNLAMLTALNRAPEIKLHVKGALNNGVTVEEIKAALLHATAYCGIPAGLDAFRAAHEVLVSEGVLKNPEADFSKVSPNTEFPAKAGTHFPATQAWKNGSRLSPGLRCCVAAPLSYNQPLPRSTGQRERGLPQEPSIPSSPAGIRPGPSGGTPHRLGSCG
jgi:4-carboxymuconolactone decarboxylase